MNTPGEKLGIIGVLMGGCSPERDISFESGRAVCRALNEAGCKAFSLEIDSIAKEDIIPQIKEAGIDVAFIALHGEFGEDGCVQAILEEIGIPYTGSDVASSRLAMNKALTKKKLNQNGFVLPEYRIIQKKEERKREDILQAFQEFPVVVKPVSSGSSIGTTIVREEDHLREAMDVAFQYGQEIIIERYIEGKEVAAGILGTEPLPLVEIRPKNAFFDFTAKYQKGMTDYIVPADISGDITKKIQRMALEAHQDLGCRDFSRVDFRLDGQGNPFLLEVNTIPGFTATSLLPMAAQQVGYSFPELCLKITRFAAQREGGAQGFYGKEKKYTEIS